MNDPLIEKLLSRAPRPAPPKGLMKKLESDITLPEKEGAATHRFNGVTNRGPPLASSAGVHRIPPELRGAHRHAGEPGRRVETRK